MSGIRGSFQIEAERILMIGQLVQGMQLKEVIETSARSDAFMPIFDPTAWMRSSQDHRKIAALAELLLPFQRAAAKLIQEREKAPVKVEEGELS